MSSSRATLIVNRNAGNVSDKHVEELQDAFRAAGYDPVYRATSNESDLDAVLKDIEGLVIAAGGDGTARAVATRLLGKDATLSILPMGTANNICRALGIEGTPLEIIARLENAGHKDAPRRYLDVGQVHAPWGTDYFVEAAGCGFYADVLNAYDVEQGKSVPRAIGSIIETLTQYDAHPYHIRLDGRDISGNFLWLEILNTPATGPRLTLAPDADPGDGLFDVVCIHEDDRVGFLKYFKNLITQDLDELPNVEVFRGRKLEWEWNGVPLHIDAEVRPASSVRPKSTEPAGGARYEFDTNDNTITVEIIPRALELRLPRPLAAEDEA